MGPKQKLEGNFKNTFRCPKIMLKNSTPNPMGCGTLSALKGH
jgi:hypothetical protein